MVEAIRMSRATSGGAIRPRSDPMGSLSNNRLELVREIIAHHMVGAAKEPGAAAGHLRRASGFKAG